MAKPYSIKEQRANDYFRADAMITVFFAEQKFDNVVDKIDGKPYYSNLTTCYHDAEVMKDTLGKYRISDKDISHDLTNNPTESKVK